jgi:hypothetical protein
LVCQSREESQLHHLALAIVSARFLESPECFIDGLDLYCHTLLIAGGIKLIEEIDALQVPAAPQSASSACMVDQDPAHGLGRDAKKMGSVLTAESPIARQPQPSFMDKRGGLQRVATSLAAHLPGGKPAQFAIQKRP